MSCFKRNKHTLLSDEDTEGGQAAKKKGPEAPSLKKNWQTIKTLLPYLWPTGDTDTKVRVVGSLTCLLAAKVFNVLVPIIYKNAVDAITGENSTSRVYFPYSIVIYYGIAKLCSSAFGDLRDAIFVKVTQQALRSSAMKTFSHLHSLSLQYHLNRQTGGVLRAIERGTQAISTLLSFFLFSIGPIILEVVLTCVLLVILYEAWFAVITFLTIVIYIAFTLSITEWRNKFRRMMNEQDNAANNKAVDSLLNYETVKYFCAEEHEKKRYDTALVNYMNAAVKSQTSLVLLNVGQSFIIAIGCVSVMLLAGKRAVQGTMTAGDFVLVNTYVLQLYLPLNFLGSAYRMIRQALVDLENMFQILDVPQDVADVADAQALVVAKGEVVFENVEFRYQQETQILRGISFTVKPGTLVAIVGPSGAGKSTISRLLFRFYDIQGGRILIDGQDIRDITQGSLRQNIGIVPQDTVLFNDSVGYNIRYGRMNATNSEVENAARTAQIKDTIEAMPKGYETVVGERGLRLSGGEKQRVSIARAVLKDPRIMVFDEATSALDSKTEKEIQAALYDVSQGRTTLVVAHRLSTIVHADEILVLKDGVIAERGTHQQLLELNGEYQQMWNRQQEAAAAEPKEKEAPVVAGPSGAGVGGGHGHGHGHGR